MGEPAYVYRFSYVPSNLQQRVPNGAPHAFEIPYVFNNLRNFNRYKATSVDKKVAEIMNTYWANFAKTGDPNGRGLPIWPVFNSRTDSIVEFRSDGSVKAEDDSHKARLDVIEKAAKSGKKLLTDGIYSTVRKINPWQLLVVSST